LFWGNTPSEHSATGYREASLVPKLMLISVPACSTLADIRIMVVKKRALLRLVDTTAPDPGRRQRREPSFRQQVHDALARLYDPVYLQTHPLAKQLAGTDSGRTPVLAGKALRRRLLDAIGQLRPATKSGGSFNAWRSFRLLELRYVEALDPTAVQQQLGISKSQYYREHNRALDALVSVLGQENAAPNAAAGMRVLTGGSAREQPPGLSPRTRAPAAAAAESPATNLPRMLTNFVGREGELAEIRKLLGSHGLITLAGPGGIGKTRLALQAAASVRTDFREGVWLVELAALADPALVPPAVAAVLGVREEGHRPLVDTLVDALRSRHLLLVLDNCEHLVEACAQLAGALLRRCPHLRILATSREPLAITGEMTWRVPPLSLPALADGEHVSAVDDLARNEAVQLFVERTRAVRPHFSLSSHNAPAVAQLCWRLDGIPLAIELAAARLRVLSVEQVLEHLDDRFALLTGGSRTLQPRQNSLRATLDWSYDLLSDAERTLFNRLSVFAGGFTLEAVAAVCAEEGIAEAEICPHDVLDGLTQLVDRSLVVVEEVPRGMVRYRMLETLRQYARLRLAAVGEAMHVDRRHAGYYLSLAEQAEPKLFGGAQVAWLDRLGVEQENLRAALAWSQTAEGAIGHGLRTAVALWWFWHLRGHAGEGSRWLEALLAHPADVPDVLRARALYREGHLRWDLGSYPAAIVLLEESLELAQRLGDHVTMALALVTLAVVYDGQGAYDRAEVLSRRALALFQREEHAWGIPLATRVLGRHVLFQGDHQQARALLTDSLERALQLGDRWAIGQALWMLGLAARYEGDLRRAQALLEESVATFREFDERQDLARPLQTLGCVLRDLTDAGRARASLCEGLALARDAGSRHIIAACLVGLAGVACLDRQFARAARLLGATDALLGATASTLPPAERADYARFTTLVHDTLGQPAQVTIHCEGKDMSLERAIAYALTTTEPDPPAFPPELEAVARGD
jgi:predicted ATPase